MFDYICIIAAAVLSSYCVEEHKGVALLIFWEFALHEVVFLFSPFQDGYWQIYLIYASLQMGTMLILSCFRASFLITMMFFINMIYNLITAWTRLYDEFMIIYEAYATIVGTIMIIELLYMGYMTEYVANFYRKRGINNHVDSVFFVGNRNPIGSMV